MRPPYVGGLVSTTPDRVRYPGRVTERSSRNLVRVNINLTPRSAAALGKIKESTGDGTTDAINRALQIYAYVQEQIDSGASLFIKDAGSDVAELLRLL